MTGSFVLGLDIGSVSISLILLSAQRSLEHVDYRFHRGMIAETLKAMLEPLCPCKLSSVACTSSTPQIVKTARVYDSQICMIEAARFFHGRLGSLLAVGGERFFLLRFDPDGKFKDLKSSTSCAAGTGSFLDQQAGRLGLSGSAELSEMAQSNRGTVPKIASRCAVFAKTDLCHAQQAGYSLEEICDGLCLGLARNIADTISSGQEIAATAVFAGGVSRNAAVVRHLEELLGCRFEVGTWSHLYGATGAALNQLKERAAAGSVSGATVFSRAEDLIDVQPEQKSYFYEPLELKLSEYPDFGGHGCSLFYPSKSPWAIPVEVDLYAPVAKKSKGEVILGIDIGSTSTKAIVIDASKRVLAGFYTRTAGRPLPAVQAIFEAFADLLSQNQAHLTIKAVGTTGAGRKFIGKVIGADLILNEITAHARAAYEIDAQIDTIIEIGGQDSKFTTMRDGRVNFSQMNTVCAAGTGSFIEEQAAKLGVGLDEYSKRAEGVRAPLASDRCTVFMERDINHYLNKKYTVDEILAAALFSVRENYLLKVASEALIGKRICFQGATAKNRALVAAFEQKLGTPIFVSRYCHLTGALGVALTLQGDPPASSTFRGIELYTQRIPVRAETCELCTNHCRLRIAEVQGQTVAYGFLCGRDYDVKRYVNRNSSGFDMIKAYRGAFEESAPDGKASPRRHVKVGIPAALHLLEELPLWKRFFAELGIDVLTSEGYREALKSGKEVTGAEFCAPITALHGHARHLAQRCDFLFLPIYLEAASDDRRRGKLRYYCYYTQFAPSLISLLKEDGLDGKCLLLLVDHGSVKHPASALARKARHRSKRELFRALQNLKDCTISLEEVSRAYDRALEAYRAGRDRLQQVYLRERSRNANIEVVLTGRPYQILCPDMNKGIPDIFASLGIKTFYQDMLPRFTELDGRSPPISAREIVGEIEQEVRPLLDAVHWHYAARILETAAFCVASKGLYPVLITAFKCSPDSFVIEYFKKILDAHKKPYLILQIDDHDSSVGYETRIEAGIHSFANHASSQPGITSGVKEVPVVNTFHPKLDFELEGRTLLFPNWDRLTIPLVVANLRSAGVDARVLEEDELSIQKSTRLNSGQCLPINAITQSMVDYIKKYDLDPSRTLLWMVASIWSCNIHLFPQHIKSLLDAYGGGMEKAGVYAGDLSHSDISPLLAIGAYFAYLFGGLLRKLGCRIRPYELIAGQTDTAVAAVLKIFEQAFLGQRSREDALAEAIEIFEAIPKTEDHKPKVAIFGDLYVRDNDMMNQRLIAFIEQIGGEVVTTPYSEYLRIVADATFKKWRKENRYFVLAKYRTILALVKLAEKKFFSYYGDYLSSAASFRNPRAEESLGRFNVRLEHQGESWDNLLKICHLVKEYPDLRLFVQTNPVFCCPSLVTEAMTRRIEEITGVPVVTLTYDGTGSFKNDKIVPYLAEARAADKASSPVSTAASGLR